MKQENPEPQPDIRLKATTAIWGTAMGMLGISIPLCAITNSTIIPLVAIAGAAIGTCGVWIFGNKKQGSAQNNAEIAAQQRIAELEERLANLETINNFERRLAEEALKRETAPLIVPSGAVMKDEQSEVTTSVDAGGVAA
jgi:hypothetical protein